MSKKLNGTAPTPTAPQGPDTAIHKLDASVYWKLKFLIMQIERDDAELTRRRHELTVVDRDRTAHIQQFQEAAATAGLQVATTIYDFRDKDFTLTPRLAQAAGPRAVTLPMPPPGDPPAPPA